MEQTKLTTDDVMKLVSNIQKQIDYKIPSINEGGCGWFAYYFDTIVKPYYKNIRIYPCIRRSNSSIYKLRKFTNEVKNNNKKNTNELSCSHVFILIDNKIFIDGKDNTETSEVTQFNSAKKVSKFISVKTLKIMLEAGNEAGSWNSEYQYKKYNPMVQEIITNELNKFLKKDITKIKSIL